jgi:putative membrane protein
MRHKVETVSIVKNYLIVLQPFWTEFLSWVVICIFSIGGVMKFIAQLLISALSLGVAAYIVPGIHVDDLLTLLIAAFLLGIVNAIVRPILFILTLPVTIVTLGLFLFVVNAAMLALVAWILPGFSISSFGAAFLGWLIVFITSSIATKLFGE